MYVSWQRKYSVSCQRSSLLRYISILLNWFLLLSSLRKLVWYAGEGALANYITSYSETILRVLVNDLWPRFSLFCARWDKCRSLLSVFVLQHRPTTGSSEGLTMNTEGSWGIGSFRTASFHWLTLLLLIIWSLLWKFYDNFCSQTNFLLSRSLCPSDSINSLAPPSPQILLLLILQISLTTHSPPTPISLLLSKLSHCPPSQTLNLDTFKKHLGLFKRLQSKKNPKHNSCQSLEKLHH